MKKKIERKLAKQAPEQEVKSPVIDWQQPKVINRHGRVFANSEKAKEFGMRHAGIFPRARKLIQRKIGLIEKGRIVTDEQCKITVQRASTGDFSGTKKFLTMKVIVEGRAFFVKLARPDIIRANVNGLILADEFLRKIGYKWGRFNVRAIMPYKAVAFKGSSYLATDFFRPDEVMQVSEMKNAGEITRCLREIDTELSKIHIYDTLPENAFYHKKTNTILLFDLSA